MIERASELIGSARRIVAFSGAGLSAESGVPTFRDAATGGLWLEHDPTRLASPAGFAADPALVIDWYNHRRRAVHAARPNPAHLALAESAAGGIVANVTQNVDDLLDRAGATGVIRLHGTLDRDRCNAGCGHEEPVDLGDPAALRACPRCGDRLRPAVVWYGEPLPADAWTAAERACTSCDVMLVIGTAAEVYPAAGLIGTAASAGAKIIVVNTQPSAAGTTADLELIGPAGTLVPALLGRGAR